MTTISGGTSISAVNSFSVSNPNAGTVVTAKYTIPDGSYIQVFSIDVHSERFGAGGAGSSLTLSIEDPEGNVVINALDSVNVNTAGNAFHDAGSKCGVDGNGISYNSILIPAGFKVSLLSSNDSQWRNTTGKVYFVEFSG